MERRARDLSANRGIDVPAALLNRLEVKARPRQQSVATPKITTPRITCADPSWRVPRCSHSLQTSSPLTAERSTVRGDVGDGGEDLLPIPADLLAAREAALRVRRCVIPVVGTAKQATTAFHIVRVRGALEPREHACRGVDRSSSVVISPPP